MSFPVIETAGAPRVLVVEDEPKMRKSVAEGFRLEPWTVQTAATGEEAIASLRGRSGESGERGQLEQSRRAVIPAALPVQDRDARGTGTGRLINYNWLTGARAMRATCSTPCLASRRS